MYLSTTLWPLVMALAHLSAPIPPQPTIRYNVEFGQGTIAASKPVPIRRPLLMDVYSPANAKKGDARPAIILAFGGSFHRGTRGDTHFTEGGARDSSMAEYCRFFALNGYVCFAIDYRLTPEDPAPDHIVDASIMTDRSVILSAAATARIDVARTQMGLPPLDEISRQQYWRSMVSATQDMQTAFEYVSAHEALYAIDKKHIAIGGFSAGAITAINAAYGLKVPAKAVISISGAYGVYDIAKTAKHGDPPLLSFTGQFDLPGIILGTQAVASVLETQKISHKNAEAHGFAHFYPMGVPTSVENSAPMTLEDRMLEFLHDNGLTPRLR